MLFILIIFFSSSIVLADGDAFSDAKNCALFLASLAHAEKLDLLGQLKVQRAKFHRYEKSLQKTRGKKREELVRQVRNLKYDVEKKAHQYLVETGWNQFLNEAKLSYFSERDTPIDETFRNAILDGSPVLDRWRSEIEGDRLSFEEKRLLWNAMTRIPETLTPKIYESLSYAEQQKINQGDRRGDLAGHTAGEDLAATFVPVGALLKEWEKALKKTNSMTEAAKAVRAEHSKKVAFAIRKYIGLNARNETPNLIDSSGHITLSDSIDPYGYGFQRAERARLVMEANLDLSGLNSKEREYVLNAAEAMEKTRKNLYSGRNALLKTLRFTEQQQTPGFRDRSIDDFIQHERYKVGSVWWSEPGETASITAETSGSPLKRLYGAAATREVYWPRIKNDSDDFNLGSIRIAVNKAPNEKGEIVDRSLELFVRNEEGEWEPFFYIKRGTQWVPSNDFLGHASKLTREEKEAGKELKRQCAVCHLNKATGRFSPRPPVLRGSPETLLESGYFSQFVHKLMAF